MNLASPNPVTLAKSKQSLIDEMTRCQQLGLHLYNFHPGSTCGKYSTTIGIKMIADGINYALEKTKGSNVVAGE